MKRFFEWFGLKQRLHYITHSPPLVSERDIWWASIGENVGSEINGKSALFSRPVIVLKKLSHGFYFVIPTTTQVREGSWYVPFRQQGRICLPVFIKRGQSTFADYRQGSDKLTAMTLSA